MVFVSFWQREGRRGKLFVKILWNWILRTILQNTAPEMITETSLVLRMSSGINPVPENT